MGEPTTAAAPVVGEWSDTQTLPGDEAIDKHPLSATVVIPTRNRGRMIEECLRSMIALDHDDLRILVIDQSTDDENRRSADPVGRPRS